MFDVFHHAFMQRALLSSILAVIPLSLLGVLLVPRGQSLLGAGLSQVAFFGVSLGLWMGVSPTGSALAVTSAAAGLVEWGRIRGILLADAATAVLFCGGLAFGTVFLSGGHGLQADVLSYLFGSAITISWRQVWQLAGVSAVIVSSIVLLRPSLIHLIFDEDSAKARGLRVLPLNLCLTGASAVLLVMTIQSVGLLLSSTLLVFPALAALRVAPSYRHAFWVAPAIGGASIVLGFWLALWADLSLGGALAASSVLVSGLVVAVGSLWGLFRTNPSSHASQQ